MSLLVTQKAYILNNSCKITFLAKLQGLSLKGQLLSALVGGCSDMSCLFYFYYIIIIIILLFHGVSQVLFFILINIIPQLISFFKHKTNISFIYITILIIPFKTR